MTVGTYHPLRMLIVGDPGAGKTAAYGSLLKHGHRLFVADFDANMEPILQFIPEGDRAGLTFETLLDPLAFDQNLSPIPVGTPKAFRRFVELMTVWKVQEFGPTDWLVIDTLSSMGPAVFRQILKDHKRFAKEPRVRVRQKEWAVAIERMETLLDFLKQLRCNVIATAHLQRLTAPSVEEDDDEEEGAAKKPPSKKLHMTAAQAEVFSKRYPSTLGQKLPLRIAGQFNVMLQAKRLGHGAASRYVLKTQPDDDVDIKCPVLKGPAEVEGQNLIQVVRSLRPEVKAS